MPYPKHGPATSTKAVRQPHNRYGGAAHTPNRPKPMQHVTRVPGGGIPAKEIEKMTVPELREVALNRGHAVPSKARKLDLMKMLGVRR